MEDTESQLAISYTQERLPVADLTYIQLSYLLKGPMKSPKQPRLLLKNKKGCPLETQIRKPSIQLVEYGEFKLVPVRSLYC